MSTVATTIPALKPVQASDVDAELERSLTTEWDAQIVDYPTDQFPFSEWILNRIRGMGYALDNLDYLHLAVPQPEVFKVTKQLCADTNKPLDGSRCAFPNISSSDTGVPSSG